MVTVFIPLILRPLTGGIAQIPAAGTTVREVVADLERQYPAMKGYVIDEAGFRPEVFVAINDEEAFGLDAPVPEDAEFHIVPAIAGGSFAQECQQQELQRE